MAQSTRLGTRTSNTNATKYIADRIGFVGNNLYGVLVNSDELETRSFGRLDSLTVSDLVNDKPDYIVYSYGTPIAWHYSAGWHTPAIKYSSTTSRHQSLVRRAIS